MMQNQSEGISCPQTKATNRQRAVPTNSHNATSPPLQSDRPLQSEDSEVDAWRETIEKALGDPYRGSSPTLPRRGHATCPPTITRGHVCGHQCTGISPRLLDLWGGQKAACRRLCHIRLELRHDENDNAYRGVACWNSQDEWILSALATFDEKYLSIRPTLLEKRAGATNTGGGISRKSFELVITAMADAADHATGRNCRLSNAQIAQRAGLSVTTITRARFAMLLLGVATEVMRGRQRTRDERMASWRVGDKARGWASVWALHPSKPHGYADNSMSESGCVRPGNNKMATHPCQGLLPPPPSSSSFTHLAKNCGKRSASRSKDNKRVARNTNPPSQKALVLALKWLADPRTPDWAHRYRADAWARRLEPAAEHGWTPQDLNDELRPAAEVRWPLAYVTTMLKKVDLPFPSHVLQEIDEKHATEQQAAFDAAFRREMAAARQAEEKRLEAIREEGRNSPARREALALARALHEKTLKDQKEKRGLFALPARPWER